MRLAVKSVGLAALAGATGWAMASWLGGEGGVLSVREARALRATLVLMVGVDDRPASRIVRAGSTPTVGATRMEWRTTGDAPAVEADVTMDESTYASWARRHFSPAELADPETSGPDAIYGADGMTNLLKYAFDLPAKGDGTAALPVTTEAGGHWFHTFAASAGASDVEWRVEASTDLERWTAEGVTLEPISVEGGKIVWQAQFHPASSEEPVIFRLWPRLKI